MALLPSFLAIPSALRCAAKGTGLPHPACNFQDACKMRADGLSLFGASFDDRNLKVESITGTPGTLKAKRKYLDRNSKAESIVRSAYVPFYLHQESHLQVESVSAINMLASS
jgi:hypothetical protein